MTHQLESDNGTHTFEVIDGPILRVELAGEHHEVEIVERGALTLLLVDGTPVELTAVAGTASLGSLTARLLEAHEHGGGSASRSERVVAPMPGRVVSIACRVGDVVTRGQPLLVLEAMKMENELTAPSDGVVTAILTQPDATIEAGSALVELGPPDTASES